MDIILYHLFIRTRIAVDHARSMARSGQKDAARDWSRFLLDGQILALLGHYHGPVVIDLDTLKADLGKLNDEVHPLSHSDHTSEFTELRANIDSLAFGISALLAREKNNKTTKRKLK